MTGFRKINHILQVRGMGTSINFRIIAICSSHIKLLDTLYHVKYLESFVPLTNDTVNNVSQCMYVFQCDII